MSLAGKHLRYGDCIILSSTESPYSYLAARSLLEEDLYFVQASINHPSFSNYNMYNNFAELIFCIYPKLSYQAEKQYAKQKLLEKDKRRLEIMKKRVQNEKNQNEQTIQRYRGQPVTIGSEVILLHYYSQSFVRASQEKSQKQSEIGLLNLKLSSQLDSRLTFRVRIDPYFSFKKTGDRVCYEDSFYFENAKMKTLIEYRRAPKVDYTSPAKKNDIQGRINLPAIMEQCIGFDKYRAEHISSSPVVAVLQQNVQAGAGTAILQGPASAVSQGDVGLLNSSPKSNLLQNKEDPLVDMVQKMASQGGDSNKDNDISTFCAIPFSTPDAMQDDQTSRVLYYGQYVRIKHIVRGDKQQGFLSCQSNVAGWFPQTHICIQKGTLSYELDPISAIFQIVSLQPDLIGQPIKISKTGYIEQLIFLRHVLTGRFLSVPEVMQNGQLQLQLHEGLNEFLVQTSSSTLNQKGPSLTILEELNQLPRKDWKTKQSSRLTGGSFDINSPEGLPPPLLLGHTSKDRASNNGSMMNLEDAKDNAGAQQQGGNGNATAGKYLQRIKLQLITPLVEDETLTTSSYFQIANAQNTQFLKVDDVGEDPQKIVIEEQLHPQGFLSSDFFIPIFRNMNPLNSTYYMVGGSRQSDYFFFSIVSKQDVADMLSVASKLHSLILLCECPVHQLVQSAVSSNVPASSSGSKQQLNATIIIDNGIHSLEKLCQWMCDCLDTSIDKIDKNPMPRRQSILRELGTIDLCFKILHSLLQFQTPKQLVFSPEMSKQHNQLYKLCVVIITFLRLVNMQHYNNSIYTFQWYYVVKSIVTSSQLPTEVQLDILLNELFQQTLINVTFESEIGNICNSLVFEQYNNQALNLLIGFCSYNPYRQKDSFEDIVNTVFKQNSQNLFNKFFFSKREQQLQMLLAINQDEGNGSEQDQMVGNIDKYIQQQDQERNLILQQQVNEVAPIIQRDVEENDEGEEGEGGEEGQIGQKKQYQRLLVDDLLEKVYPEKFKYLLGLIKLSSEISRGDPGMMKGELRHLCSYRTCVQSFINKDVHALFRAQFLDLFVASYLAFDFRYSENLTYPKYLQLKPGVKVDQQLSQQWLLNQRSITDKYLSQTMNEQKQLAQGETIFRFNLKEFIFEFLQDEQGLNVMLKENKDHRILHSMLMLTNFLLQKGFFDDAGVTNLFGLLIGLLRNFIQSAFKSGGNGSREVAVGKDEVNVNEEEDQLTDKMQSVKAGASTPGPGVGTGMSTSGPGARNNKMIQLNSQSLPSVQQSQQRKQTVKLMHRQDKRSNLIDLSFNWISELLKSLTFIEKYKQQRKIQQFFEDKKYLQIYEKSYLQSLSEKQMKNTEFVKNTVKKLQQEKQNKVLEYLRTSGSADQELAQQYLRLLNLNNNQVTQQIVHLIYTIFTSSCTVLNMFNHILLISDNNVALYNKLQNIYQRLHRLRTDFVNPAGAGSIGGSTGAVGKGSKPSNLSLFQSLDEGLFELVDIIFIDYSNISDKLIQISLQQAEMDEEHQVTTFQASNQPKSLLYKNSNPSQTEEEFNTEAAELLTGIKKQQQQKPKDRQSLQPPQPTSAAALIEAKNRQSMPSKKVEISGSGPSPVERAKRAKEAEKQRLGLGGTGSAQKGGAILWSIMDMFTFDVKQAFKLQDMLRHLNFHQLMMNTVRAIAQSIGTRYKNDPEIEYKENIIEKCLVFLIFFSMKNQQNQAALVESDQFNQFIKDLLSLKFRQLQTYILLFIKELIKDNYQLLANNAQAVEILDMLFVKYSFNHQQKFYDQCIYFLHLLQYFYLVRDSALTQNQLMLIRLISYKYDTKSSFFQCLQLANLSKVAENRKAIQRCVYVPQPVAQACTILSSMRHLVTLAGDGSNKKVLADSKHFLSLVQIKSLLKSPEPWWIFKLEVLQYFVRVYLSNKKLEEGEQQEVIFIISEILLLHLQQYITDTQKTSQPNELFSFRFISDIPNSFVNITSYSSISRVVDIPYREAYDNYVYLGIIDAVNIYINRYIKDIVGQVDSAYITQYLQKLQELEQRIINGDTDLQFDVVQDQNLKKVHIQEEEEQPKPQNDSKYFTINQSSNSHNVTLLCNLIQQIQLTQTYWKANSKLSLPSSMVRAERVWNRLKEHQNFIIEETTLNIESTTEMSLLIGLLVKTKNENEEQFKKIIQNLINMLADAHVSKDLKIMTLKILRSLTNYKLPEDNAKMQAAAMAGTTTSIHQDLCSMGFSNFLCRLISEEGSEDFKAEYINCLIDFLDEGDIDIQESLFSFMQNDLNNTFLICLHRLILSSFYEIKEYEKAMKGSVLGSGRGSGMGVQPRLVTRKIQGVIYSKIQCCKSAIQVLKLACEGHFIKMQDYLREQVIKDKKITRSVNLVQFGAELFCEYCKFYNTGNVELGECILDFLIEVVQGPCTANQLCLVETKILECIEDLMFEVIAHSKSQISVENIMFATFTKRIYVFLLSLFEANKDEYIIAKIGQYINPEFLLSRLEFIYWNIIKPSKNDQQKHVRTLQKKLTQLSVKQSPGSILAASVADYEQAQCSINRPNANANSGPSANAINNQNDNVNTTDDDFLIQNIDGLDDFYASMIAMQGDAEHEQNVHLQKMYQQKVEDLVDEANTIYILIKSISQFLPSVKTIFKKAKMQIKQAGSKAVRMRKTIQFFKTNIARIEIINEQNELQLLYFAKPSLCNYLSSRSKEYFTDTVNRDSANDKINGLLDNQQVFIDEMVHFQFLRKNLPILNLDFWYIQFRRFVLTIALVINLIILFDEYEDSCEDCANLTDDLLVQQPCVCPESTGSKLEGGIIVLGIIELILNITTFLLWAIIQFILDYKKSNRQFDHYYFLKQKPTKESIKEFKDQFTLKQKKNLYKNFDTKGYIIYFFFMLQYMTFNSYFIYLLLMTLFTILGLVVSRVFYCFLLLDVIDRSMVLRNVIKSITVNYKQLLMTAILGVVVIYIYGMIGYYIPMVHSTLSPQQLQVPLCVDAFNCFLFALNLGLRSGGGVGDIVNQPIYYEKESYTARFFYDFTFFIFIIIILLNIIFGIIIDTFAELRDEKTLRDQDQKNKCFICSIERTIFEKEGVFFDHHAQKEHSVWNFFFYTVYLRKKDEIDYNGTESYVAKKLRSGDISWFPIGKALSLENFDQGQDEEQIHQLLKGIDQNLQSLMSEKLANTKAKQKNE